MFESLNSEDITVEHHTAERCVEHEVVASEFDLPSISGGESNEKSESFDEASHVDEREDTANSDLAGCLRDWPIH